MEIRCFRCNAAMECNPGDCWCETLPVLAEADLSEGCYCPSCLKSAIEDSARDQSTAESGKSA
jgi:hypothetical protein